MKIFLYKLILLTIFATVIKIFPQELIITQEEKEEIISYLDSVDYQGAINTITEYKISEAREKIELVFWEAKFSRLDQIRLLYLLSEFSSSYTQSYALAFIDTLNNIPSDYSGDDPSYLKARAAGILVQLGDNSKVNLFFDFINEAELNYSFTILDVLPVIMENVPEHELEAKIELIRIVNLSDFNLERISALKSLYKKYGTEMLPLMLQVFAEDEEYNNRQIVLDTLLACCNSSELHSLLRERLVLDPHFYLRYKIAGKLLNVYGTPEDYKFILDYLPNESDIKVREYIQQNLELFEPPKPDSILTIENLINNTLVQTGTLYSFTWLGDLQFKNKLQTILQSAKTNLLAGDSLACAVQVKSFKDSVDFVYADSLNTDPRFITLEGWKFLYWNAQYILDRLPEIPIQLVSTYSILATHSLKLNQYSVIVQSGDIGVNEAGLEPFLDPGYELSVGANATTPAGYKVIANRIKLNQNSVINGDIYYNELNNSQGIINGSQTTPIELPLFAALPEFKTSIPGTENIIVSNGQTRVLSPGSYGNVTINKNGTLVLTGGVYHFNGFVGGQQSNINYQSPCEIRIAGKLDIGKLSNVIASDTTTYSAKDIVFYVAGINGTDGTLGATPKAAVIGTDSKIKANLYVPNGTLQIKANSEAEGSFIGKDVDIDAGVKVKLKSAF